MNHWMNEWSDAGPATCWSDQWLAGNRFLTSNLNLISFWFRFLLQLINFFLFFFHSWIQNHFPNVMPCDFMMSLVIRYRRDRHQVHLVLRIPAASRLFFLHKRAFQIWSMDLLWQNEPFYNQVRSKSQENRAALFHVTSWEKGLWVPSLRRNFLLTNARTDAQKRRKEEVWKFRICAFERFIVRMERCIASPKFMYMWVVTVETDAENHSRHAVTGDSAKSSGFWHFVSRFPFVFPLNQYTLFSQDPDKNLTWRWCCCEEVINKLAEQMPSCRVFEHVLRGDALCPFCLCVCCVCDVCSWICMFCFWKALNWGDGNPAPGFFF